MLRLASTLIEWVGFFNREAVPPSRVRTPPSCFGSEVRRTRAYLEPFRVSTD